VGINGSRELENELCALDLAQSAEELTCIYFMGKKFLPKHASLMRGAYLIFLGN